MAKLREIAAFIEREAGNVTVGLFLIFVGAVLVKLGIPKAEDLIPFALGIIARSMLGQGEGKKA